MKRWYLALFAAYTLIVLKAYADARKLWRQARLLRAVMGDGK